VAGQRPFFLTGANAKIIVNGVTMAFATNISYSVQVNHNSPRVLGRYEVEEHQPLSYDVFGGFAIIRYVKNIGQGNKIAGVTTSPDGVDAEGNGIGSWQRGTGGSLGSMLSLPGTDGAGNGHANENMVPGRLHQSQMFDIEIRQQAAGGGECTVARLRNCRITSSNFVLANKRTVATQAFTFKAQAVDEDTFTAMKSGVGQELT